MRSMEAGSVDAVVTDPPYEAEAHTAMRRTRAVIEKREEIAAMPFEPITDTIRADLVNNCKKLSRGWAIVFCQAEAVGKYHDLFGDAWRRPMVWIKPDSAPQFTGDRPAMGYESICAAWCNGPSSKWNGGGKRGVFTFNSTGYEHLHPTQKPIGLMKMLVELFTSPGDTIFDPFMGSGTTGVACMMTGRNFIGCEIDPSYYAIAQRRIAAAAAQPLLFA
jgi:site-specific DNA-methyltransferase (adenine-specific)